VGNVYLKAIEKHNEKENRGSILKEKGGGGKRERGNIRDMPFINLN
jgi:hypothetical protein